MSFKLQLNKNVPPYYLFVMKNMKGFLNFKFLNLGFREIFKIGFLLPAQERSGLPCGNWGGWTLSEIIILSAVTN